jgi:hypothetical protein
MMVWDELTRDAESENDRDRDRWIGVYIGVLAVLLAICSMGGGNATKDATLKNIEASNTWAFFQAKNMRRHVLRVQTEDLLLRLKVQHDLTPDGRAAIESKISDYKQQDEVLTSGDPAKPVELREGLDQLFEKGKRLEAERDVAMRRDPYFDYGEALLQIAIILASIALITRGSFLLSVSGALAVVGTLLTLNGFTLAVAVPGLG